MRVKGRIAVRVLVVLVFFVGLALALLVLRHNNEDSVSSTAQHWVLENHDDAVSEGVVFACMRQVKERCYEC